MKQRAPIIIFAIAYALSINLAKGLLTFFYSGKTVDPGLMLSLLNDFTIGFLIIALSGIVKHPSLKLVFISTISVLTIIVEFLAYHYYLIFDRLPGAGILFYISELDQLQTSINNNIPILTILIEVVVVCVMILIFNKTLTVYGKEVFQKKVLEILSAIIILVSVFIQIFPATIPAKYKWQARQELIWMLQSQFVSTKYDIKQLALNKHHFDQYLQALGNESPGPVINPEYPLCRFQKAKAPISKRNIILLILEGVSRNEMYSEYNDIPLMPNLINIADENLSFQKFYAAGSKSAQALTAIFSGLPAHTNYHYLWTKPLINLNGFPKKLKSQGYSTAYFHGSDLSFEQQRQYLKNTGFEFIYEYNPDYQHDLYGWGYSDEAMFDELKQWIENSIHERPYLASLFTISTHDPYLLPKDWQPVFSNTDLNQKSETNWTLLKDLASIKIAAKESYRYLDYQLAEFYKWYEENEKQKGTVLIITGDHGSYLFSEGQKVDQQNQFNVPLIIAGNDLNSDSFGINSTQKIAGHHDLPATVMGLLDSNAHACNTGIELLAGKTMDSNRLLYSVAGDELENIYIWQNEKKWLLERDQEKLYSINGNKMQLLRNDEYSAETKKLLENLSNIFKVNYYLLKNNRYFPEQTSPVPKVVIQRNFSNPLFVSHRGNINGAGDALYENSKSALEAVVGSEFEWVEIDVQLTADGIPVLIHDPFAVLPDGTKQDVISLTFSSLKTIDGYQDILSLEQALQIYASKLNLLIEVKAPEHISDVLHIGREVSRLVKKYKTDKTIVVDSFHEEIITSIKQQCECETGLDAPYKTILDKEALKYIKNLGMDWVYLHYSVVTPEIITLAHNEGLKVMAYTVNSDEVVKQWRSNLLPDGIITDDISIKQSAR